MTLDRLDRHDELLRELHATVARLDERTKTIIDKLDDAVVSREHLENRLAPLTENMNKWKGALTVVTVIAGAIGATVATLLKRMLGIDT